MLFSLAVVVLAPSAAALTIMWPNEVLQETNRSVQWSGGIPPYELDINSLYPTKRLNTYIGNDLILYWYIDVPPGTVIQYNVTDSVGTHINSTALTVQPNPLLSSASLLSISSTQSLASVSSVSIISTSSTGAPTSTHSNPSSTLSSRTSNSPSPTRTSSGGRSNTRIIAGAVVGAIALLLIGLAAFFLLRRRRKYSQQTEDTEEPYTVYPSGYAQVATQNVPSPAQSAPLDTILSAYHTDAMDPSGVSVFPGTVGSMMTAPTNEDEEYYNRVVMGGRGGYVRVSGVRGYSSTPGSG